MCIIQIKMSYGSIQPPSYSLLLGLCLHLFYQGLQLGTLSLSFSLGLAEGVCLQFHAVKLGDGAIAGAGGVPQLSGQQRQLLLVGLELFFLQSQLLLQDLDVTLPKTKWLRARV